MPRKMESLTTSGREFLNLCDMEYVDGSGHSVEALSPSEIDKASSDTIHPSGSDTVESVQLDEKTVSTPSDVVFEEEQSNGSDIVYESVPAGPSCSEDISTVPETPESVVLETPLEFYSEPVARSATRPCDDVVGFRINPGEVPPSLAAATIKLAKKYFLN
ncbi:hypothetical protein V3C99_016235 [Haemonchus contortus]